MFEVEKNEMIESIKALRDADHDKEPDDYSDKYDQARSQCEKTIAPRRKFRRICIGMPGGSRVAASTMLSQGALMPSFEAIDRDRDGTIDLSQAKRTAERLFEQLDHRGAGKLSRAELGRGRLTVAQFSWADRDHVGTLTKDEYVALVEREFRAADLDRDGTVSRADFNSRAGLPLRRLLY